MNVGHTIGVWTISMTKARNSWTISFQSVLEFVYIYCCHDSYGKRMYFKDWGPHYLPFPYWVCLTNTVQVPDCLHDTWHDNHLHKELLN